MTLCSASWFIIFNFLFFGCVLCIVYTFICTSMYVYVHTYLHTRYVYTLSSCAFQSSLFISCWYATEPAILSLAAILWPQALNRICLKTSSIVIFYSASNGPIAAVQPRPWNLHRTPQKTNSALFACLKLMTWLCIFPK